MILRKTILTFFCILFINEFYFSQSAICSYAYRKRITFDPAQVIGPSDLTDFPALIRISSDNDLRTTANSGHVQNANGYDIIFTSEDGVTILNHQITGYSATTGSLECWVKIPNLSTSFNTNIYMYYGNSSVSTDQSSNSTWSNGYVGVWHFDNSLNNSTATSGLNGTNNGSTNTTTSKFGSARNFVGGSSQYIDVSPYNSAYDLTTNITVSGWIRLSSTGADQKILGNQNNSNGGWKFGVFSDNKIEFEIRTSGNSPSLSRSASGGTALSSGTWYYVVGEYSDAGDFINTYLNGSLDRTLSTTAVLGASSGTMKFAREPFSSGAFFSGIQDEVRLSNVIRSADWIATEYNNQNSPSTFYSISLEPAVWDGSSNSNWNTNANWVSGSVPGSGEDIILPNVGNQPNLNASKQIASLWVRTGVTLSFSNNRTLSVAYDITNCGTINGGGGTSAVQLNSTSSNVQVQNLSGSGTYNLTNLTINNTYSTTPTVVLNKDVNVSGDLTLSSGIVNTTVTNILSLGTGATSTSGSASSFISGPISKAGNSDFVFPTGKGNKWSRVAVSNISASSTFRGEYFNAAYTSTSPVNSPLTNVSKLEYWQLDRIAGSGNANVSLYWENAGQSGINNCTDLTIARWNGSSWDERAGATVGGSSCSGSGTGTVTTNAVVTAFSPFTFGSKLSGVNPLPIELIDFSAECLNSNDVVLSWITASEKNNAYFLLESSADGVDWKLIAQVEGAGNSKQEIKYTYVYKLLPNESLYYRLSQVDWDGKKEVFTTIYPDCANDLFGISLFPNPSTGQVTLRVNSPDSSRLTYIKIVDALGKICFQQEIGLEKGVNEFYFNLDLKSGMYSVLIYENDLILGFQKLILGK